MFICSCVCVYIYMLKYCSFKGYSPFIVNFICTLCKFNLNLFIINKIKRKYYFDKIKPTWKYEKTLGI